MRVLRRLFTFLSFISLLLCMATCVLWVRSQLRVDAFALERQAAYTSRYYGVCSAGGAILFAVVQDGEPDAIDLEAQDEPPAQVRWRWHPDGRTMAKEMNGLVAERRTPQRVQWLLNPDNAQDGWFEGAIVPYWLLIAITAVLPAVRYCLSIRVRKLVRMGLCPDCGYDLRASPERCPECGAATTATAENVKP